jgi:hypothetical protein
MQVHMNHHASISWWIQAQEAAGYGFRLPAWRAALAGDIHLVDVGPHGRVDRRFLRPGAPPTLIILGDDGAWTPGPAGFPQARRLAAWTDGVLLHASGGEARHYELAVEMTRINRRCLMIETADARAGDWAALLEAEAARRAHGPRRPLNLAFIVTEAASPPHPQPGARP